MKHTLAILLMLSFPSLVIAQEISISEMIDFYFERDWQKTNIDLTATGWDFDGVTAGNEEEGSYNIIMWTYGVNNYNDVVRLFKLPDTPSRVFFATLNLSVYKELMSQLPSHDFTLLDTEYGDYISSTTYQNNIFKLEVALTDQPRGVSYSFLLNKR